MLMDRPSHKLTDLCQQRQQYV